MSLASLGQAAGSVSNPCQHRPPSLPTAADLREGREGPAEPELCYRPIAMGAAGALLPPWFHDELKFEESQVGRLYCELPWKAGGGSRGQEPESACKGEVRSSVDL